MPQLKQINHSSSKISKKEIHEMLQFLKKNYVGSGKKSILLESKLSELVDVKYSFAVNSGSSALNLAFKLLDLPKNSKIATNSYACFATVNAIKNAGLNPYLIDVRSHSLLPSQNSFIEAKTIKNNIQAVLFCHTGGYIGEIERLKKLKIPIIEDCAAAIGGIHSDGSPVGSKGDISIFSFNSTKHITGGQGGAIATNNNDFAKKLNRLLDYEGKIVDYNKHDFDVRFNESLSDLNCTLALSQLLVLKDKIIERRNLASVYKKYLEKKKGVIVPKLDLKCYAFWRFVFFSAQRDAWINHFKKNDIDARASIGHPLYRYFGLNNEKFPKTSIIDKELISLPIHNDLDNKDIEHIVKVIGSF